MSIEAKPNVLVEAWTHFKRHPLHFLLLQTPELIPEWIGRIYYPPGDTQMSLSGAPGLIVYLAMAQVVATLCGVAALASVLDIRAGHRPSLEATVSKIQTRIKLLVPAALLCGFVVALGILAYLLPGIFFFSVYLFVPLLVLTEEPAPLPVYFYRSWNLARPLLLKNLLLVVCLFIFSFLSQISDNYQVVQSGLGLIVGSFFNVFIACYFLKHHLKPL